MPKKKAKPKKLNPKNLKVESDKIRKKLGYTPREGGRPLNLKLYHGSANLPPVSGKPLKKGEEDYGQAVIDNTKKHMTVTDLIKALKVVRNPDSVVIWLEGSAYWGQLSGARLFDSDRAVLLMKRN